ncbi:MAG: threonine-phosphate decarboxylase CobD [Eubacteriales bacterium]|nr:threonine-phosphate decarboxylase CobD [Eubacteriales bacterium]
MKRHIHGGDIYQNQSCLDFSANCNPLGIPEAVVKAAAKSLNQAANYPQVGSPLLKEAIAGYEGLSSDMVVCGNGAAELIYTLCRAVKPGRALLTAPTFAEYEAALCSVDCQIFWYQMGESFEIQEDFAELLTENIDIVFLCNPNNPTGKLVDGELLKRLLKACAQKSIYLVVDECFMDFVENGETYSLKPYLRDYPQLFLLKAFTKRYAMAGIRLGYGLSGNQELLQRMESCVQPWNISVMAEAAGLAALKETEYVRRGVELVQSQRELLKQKMRDLGLGVQDSRANYIFFSGPEKLWEECRRHGILIRDCSNYTGLDKGWYRVAVRMPEENERLVQALAQILTDDENAGTGKEKEK